MEGKEIFHCLLSFSILTCFIFYNYPVAQWKSIKSPKCIGWKGAWQEIQQERRKRVWDTCTKYPELQRPKLEYMQFYFSSEYSLLYCTNGKTGSTTTFLTTFKQILNQGEGVEYAKG